jgi:hypothetical protein
MEQVLEWMPAERKRGRQELEAGCKRQKWQEVSGWLEKNGDLESHDISDMKKQIHMYKFSNSFTT